ncbi:MAG: hypothetical protein NTV34_15540 [Proteobacteria bacterium]|nr:hypothetical protein [Pseudomonadota bacterium]
MKNTRPLRLFCGLLLAIFAHGVALNFLHAPGPKVALKSIAIVPTVHIRPIKISPNDLPLIQARPIPASSLPVSKASAPDRGQIKQSHAYTDLLPKHPMRVFDSGPKSGLDQHGSRASLIQGKQLEPNYQVSADALASYISIPLVWRSEAKDGRAVVRLSIDDLETLWIRSLYGEPILRAALFESLTNVATQTYLRELMSTQKRRELTIELFFQQSPDSYRGLNTESVAFEDGIRITKRMPPPMPKMSGLALSDRHSERAKVEEKIRLAKLFEIPAFAHTLTDFALSKKI